MFSNSIIYYFCTASIFAKKKLAFDQLNYYKNVSLNSLVGKSNHLSLQEQPWWALGFWEGDGGISIGYRGDPKLQKIRSLQIRVVQNTNQNNESLLLVFFQKNLTQ